MYLPPTFLLGQAPGMPSLLLGRGHAQELDTPEFLYGLALSYQVLQNDSLYTSGMVPSHPYSPFAYL